MIPLLPARGFSVSPASLVAAMLIPCLGFVSCASKASYKKSGMTEAKIATPPHNMSANDYPFDDDGTYRKDWVANKDAKRPKRRKATAPSSPAVVTNVPPRPQASQATLPPTHPAYPASTANTPTPGYTPPPAPTRPAPTPPPAPKPRYHTVVKGDTLFSLGRRYGVSVGQIKATNGLTSDTIRIGQTLRMP